MPQRVSLAKKTIFILLPMAITAAVFLTGLMTGRYITIARFRSLMDIEKFDSLGGNVDEVRRKAVALAYYDSRAAEKDMDGYAWQSPQVLTPFVGNAPWPGKSANAKINSTQFRMDRELEKPKPADLCRIFLTGGSTAYGSGAPSQDRTIAGYLEATLDRKLSPRTGKRYEVVTAANAGWASTHERILIENRLSALEPDVVISFSGNNDVHWGQRGENVLWFRTYSDAYFARVIDKAYRVFGRKPMPDVSAARVLPFVPAEVVAERLEENVRLSAFALFRKDVPYVFVLQPTLAATGKELAPNERAHVETWRPEARAYFTSCYQEIKRRLGGVREKNFHYVDLTDVFDTRAATDVIFLDAYHFGDRGNEIVAGSIFERTRAIIEGAGGAKRRN